MAAQPVLSDPGFSPLIVNEELAALGFTPNPIALPRWLEWVDSFSVAVLNIALLLVVALVFANTLARSIFGTPFILGIEEITRSCCWFWSPSWAVRSLIAAAILWR